MILAIQPEETVRSFVERTLFIKGKRSSEDVFRTFPNSPSRADILTLAELLGWSGCYGLNKILHTHTNYPFTAVFKNTQDVSYSRNEYISYSRCYESIRKPSGFCPVCVAEDIERLGFSFWRRAHCCELKVCAEHNVELVKRCPACDKQFSHGGHSLGVMWKTCEGRHLKDSPVTLNTDPFELKKAQIFQEILSFTHHLSEEAVLAVLNEKIHQDGVFEQKIWNFLSDRNIGDNIERRLGVVKKSRSRNRLPLDEPTDFIIKAIVETYESFADFVSDVKAYGDEIRPIESLWSTYIAGHQESTHFVEENYEFGVGYWSCPFPAKEVWGMWDWRPVYYPCCNFERPKKKGPQPQPQRVKNAPPGIYRRQ
ncbi:TniQ family protein [Pseudomonas costantinii]|uniref:TniQ family protein n=1 Tax=Pseudomonas costantinii TaxID=168469 RepID=UPI0015A4D14A|nr:TniQ family protein [Pseudomonas costantinii]NVZ21453.1 TniQ family protein [Pseudomonas costantinii]